MGSTRKQQDEYELQSIQKYFERDTFSMTCIHKRNSSRNIQIDGVLINQQCFTHPLIVLDLDSSDPHANVDNSMELAFLKQTPEALSISKISPVNIYPIHVMPSSKTSETSNPRGYPRLSPIRLNGNSTPRLYMQMLCTSARIRKSFYGTNASDILAMNTYTTPDDT